MSCLNAKKGKLIPMSSWPVNIKDSLERKKNFFTPQKGTKKGNLEMKGNFKLRCRMQKNIHFFQQRKKKNKDMDIG